MTSVRGALQLNIHKIELQLNAIKNVAARGEEHLA